MSSQACLLYNILLYFYIYLSHVLLYETKSYYFYTQCFITLLLLWFIYNLMYIAMCLYTIIAIINPLYILLAHILF